MTVAPGAERGGGVGAALVGVHGAGPFDRHLQRGADIGASRSSARLQLGGRHPHRRGAHTVERLAVLEGRLGAPLGDRLDDRPHLGHHGVDVDAAARQGGTQPGRRQVGAAQVDAGHVYAPIVPEQAKSLCRGSPRGVRLR